MRGREIEIDLWDADGSQRFKTLVFSLGLSVSPSLTSLFLFVLPCLHTFNTTQDPFHPLLHL